MNMTTVVKVECSGGCGVYIDPGFGRFCAACDELNVMLEARRVMVAQRNRSYGVGCDRARLECEAHAAPAARDPARLSKLMATLPRVTDRESVVIPAEDEWPTCQEYVDLAAMVTSVSPRERADLVMLSGAMIVMLFTAGWVLWIGLRGVLGMLLAALR